MRTRAMNQIQAAAMNEGVRRKKTLWSKTGRRQREALPLARWATRRRQDLLELVDRLNTTIDELTAAAEQEARKRPEVLRYLRLIVRKFTKLGLPLWCSHCQESPVLKVEGSRGSCREMDQMFNL